MTALDLVPAGLCVALAVRSAVHWLRRPLDSTDAADHALFALFFVTRVGSWLLLAIWFAGLADVAGEVRDETLGTRALPDEVRARYGWVIVAFFAACGVAFLASFFLARRGADRTDDPGTPAAG
ncbi:MAG TPA: hypothetical protein VE032_10925 [Actinomycetota bacterium]|nr:hypothetical protein [Actinomycetota bacterium]